MTPMTLTTASAIGGILGFSVIAACIGYATGRYREFLDQEGQKGNIRREYRKVMEAEVDYRKVCIRDSYEQGYNQGVRDTNEDADRAQKKVPPTL